MNHSITNKEWEHSVRVAQMHELVEGAKRLMHNTAFWAIAFLVAMLVTVFILALNVPEGASMNTAPVYPFPMILH